MSHSLLRKRDTKKHSIRTINTCYKKLGRTRLVKEGRSLASLWRDGKETDCRDGGPECWVSQETRWVRKDRHESGGNSHAKAQRHPGAECLACLAASCPGKANSEEVGFAVNINLK